jgi:ATPase subunit of ABC transporter with duplicated ATPase domains
VSIGVSDLAYAHPGADELFDGVSFGVADGVCAGLVGDNGVGKSTLLQILSGVLDPTDGVVRINPDRRRMAQDVGVGAPVTIRDLLLDYARDDVRAAGIRLAEAESALAATPDDPAAGIEVGAAVSGWGDVGGYEWEGRWDATVRRVLGDGLDLYADWPTDELSGGERKRLVLDTLLTSSASTLLLDEPDNELDIEGKLWLERELRSSTKTILVISHDRELLANATDRIITLEGSGAWIHGGSYATYPEARAARQERLGDELARWKDEERRLFRHMKIMKQRASLNDGNAPQANAAESRWKRFVDAGPPDPPVATAPVTIRFRAPDSSRRMVALDQVAIEGLVRPFSDEVHHGDRVGLIGANGTGKSHLIRALAGTSPHHGTVTWAPTASVGMFSQVQVRPDHDDADIGAIAARATGNHEAAMRVLARYGLAGASRRPWSTLSGGQRARLEILLLELAGHNVLLLDEPTDNLDIDSAEALEGALAAFDGTYVTISHDRTFLRQATRFWYLDADGDLYDVRGHDEAIAAVRGDGLDRTARRLTTAPR